MMDHFKEPFALLRDAFREALCLEFADVPAEEDLDYTFSPKFIQAMNDLMNGCQIDPLTQGKE